MGLCSSVRGISNVVDPVLMMMVSVDLCFGNFYQKISCAVDDRRIPRFLSTCGVDVFLGKMMRIASIQFLKSIHGVYP